ncbi:hypothetical protein JKG68_22415 [Microvirga aerilata]|uniref:Uncharacterized protein n=1 Tax=Microvirga aerilata TaxID=670292 RepID=A0A936ZGE8_9HYPH|nr:hypothetical protein [Microvirga aerilata]MBL0406707.1 hypothetical protein [Microvirga aerilata]
MFFVVTGQALNGLLAVTCETAAAAVEKARAFIADGVLDVLITDADGRQHPPSDFRRLLLGTRSL